MLKIINAHCHLLNYQFIPQSCFRTRNPTMEWMLRHRGTRPLVRIAALFAPKTRYRRIHELFDLMKMDIHAHAEMLLREMEAADIQLAAPLMMDLGRVAFQENPDPISQIKRRLGRAYSEVEQSAPEIQFLPAGGCLHYDDPRSRWSCA